jgi:acetylornithine deacetylase/succinyl-diaminopimelate desuccinylase-like protein
MKGSLAAWLAALVAQKGRLQLDNLAMLWYVDEEYDFKGMKRFVRDLPSWSTSPELVLSLDGGLELSSGCRGLIEVTMTVTGKSGHAGNPVNGVNVIIETAALFEELRAFLAKFSDAYLGPSTLNVAYLRGGTVQEQAARQFGSGRGMLYPTLPT